MWVVIRKETNKYCSLNQAHKFYDSRSKIHVRRNVSSQRKRSNFELKAIFLFFRNFFFRFQFRFNFIFSDFQTKSSSIKFLSKSRRSNRKFSLNRAFVLFCWKFCSVARKSAALCSSRFEKLIVGRKTFALDKFDRCFEPFVSSRASSNEYFRSTFDNVCFDEKWFSTRSNFVFVRRNFLRWQFSTSNDKSVQFCRRSNSSEFRTAFKWRSLKSISSINRIQTDRISD